MITSLANRITRKLLSNGYLAAAETDEVIYGLFTAISRLIFAVICISLGIVFKCTMESIVFYATFLFVKKYAGGFHASTEGRCFIISTASIVSSIWFISFCQTAINIRKILFILAIVAGAIISILSPVASVEKPLDHSDKKRYRVFSFLRVVILISACSTLYFFSIFNICIAVCVGVLLEGVFLIVGHIKQKT